MPENIIDGRALSLSGWLQVVFDPPPDTLVVDYEFPTDKHREEYLQTISDRSDKEVKRLLLKFLIPSGSLNSDQSYLFCLSHSRKTAETAGFRTEYERRLILWDAGIKGVYPWEGITWVLDLCSWSPKEAINALSAYLKAHIQVLPDGRITGLEDALAIIRARYIGTPQTNSGKVNLLLELSPRQFECLVERTYHKMGFSTILTPPQKDGGRDVLAEHNAPGRRERVLIECKRYAKPVSVSMLRALLGVVSSEKANKGVLATNSTFTKAAVEFARHNPRIELIDGTTLVCLMNEHLGATWPVDVDWLVIESERPISTAI